MSKWAKAKKTTLVPAAISREDEKNSRFNERYAKGSSPENTATFRGEKSAWDPWKHGISPSGLGLWLSCREQFRLNYVEGLRANTARMGMEFGNVCHYVLEHARKLPKPPDVLPDREHRPAFEPRVKWITAKVAEYQKLWLAEHPASGTKCRDTIDTCCGYAEVVLPVYMLRYAGDWKVGKYPATHRPGALQIGGRWKGLESSFRVTYEYPDGKKLPIQGRRDGVFESDKKLLWIFDTKCYSQYNPGDLLDVLPFDVQQMMYAWATTKELKREVDGVMLDVIRRPGQHWKQGESKKQYFDRVKSEVQQEKNWDHYFYRPEAELHPGDLARFYKDFLVPCLEDFRGWWEGRIPHYMNPNSLVGKYGKCDYFDWITKGFDMGLQRRERPAVTELS